MSTRAFLFDACLPTVVFGVRAFVGTPTRISSIGQRNGLKKVNFRTVEPRPGGLARAGKSPQDRPAQGV